MERVTVGVEGGEIDVVVEGDGPPVVMVPSLGRGRDDFARVATDLAAAGHRAVLPEVRGVAPTTAPADGVTMARLADDVAVVVREVCGGRAVVAGHAFGNRVARMTATRHPTLVRGVVLLACGGAVPPAPVHAEALRLVFDTSRSADEHLADVRLAFFAPGHDASVWVDGWYPDVAVHQVAATRAEPVETWWEAGSAPVLVVQPLDDVIALPANAADIVARLGSRAALVEVTDAGHALLPEQPEAVRDALVDWLGRLPT